MIINKNKVHERHVKELNRLAKEIKEVERSGINKDYLEGLRNYRHMIVSYYYYL